VEYTDNGNIIRMPDVGAMAYGNTAKPYQGSVWLWNNEITPALINKSFHF